jgi:glycosyltransferase involved in cell wall biosynthesis
MPSDETSAAAHPGHARGDTGPPAPIAAATAGVGAFWANSEPWQPHAADEDQPAAEAARAALRASGLIDPAHVRLQIGDCPDPEAAWAAGAWRGGLDPNPYFATRWYLESNPEVAASGIDPLLHYFVGGETAGRAPSPHFDLAWYRARHEREEGRTWLAHFLARRHAGVVSPLPEFDPGFYRTTYPDVAAAGIDPAEHYLCWGHREGRHPSAAFDTGFYRARYMGGADENPLLHFRRLRGLVTLQTRPSAPDAGPFAEARAAAAAGPGFEVPLPLPDSARRRALVLAFYLPQFHAIPENDAAWGPGFTEWTALGRAMPRFAGHVQPRLPGMLGHYRLGTDEAGRATMRAQAALARGAGIGGFVHYFYWFAGRRVLEAPTEAMLADPTIDMPFCLMWANENWTRRWDGAEDEVLLRQEVREQDDAALVAEWARHFKDPRYIRVGGRPLLMIYRADSLPDARACLARWRQLFREQHEEAPLWIMAQSFGQLDPRVHGFDAAVEFPPHKVTERIPAINDRLRWFDPEATMRVFAYEDVVAASLAEPTPEYRLIRTAIPGWDNDPRRQGAGLAVHGATPAAYGAWLSALIDRARAETLRGTPIVCVNAWNEWAEGAVLEPDRHWGGAFLNATARAVAGLATGEDRRLLLVGHDAFPAGAQRLLLALARDWRHRRGIEARCLLLGDGALLGDYAATMPTTVARGAMLEQAIGREAAGIGAAIVNSAAAAEAVPALARAGIPTLLLVHELPGMVAARGLAPALRAAAAQARVVVPAASVGRALATHFPAPPEVLGQGVAASFRYRTELRREARAALGLGAKTLLVLGAGHADLRKGFDLFLVSARAARGAVFAWAGSLHPDLAASLAPDIAALESAGRLRLLGPRDDMPALMNAADAFALTSREDPYPSVALEALATGLPVVAFADTGGIPDLLAETGLGEVVALGDAPALASACLRLARAARPARPARARRVAPRLAFDRYADAVLARAMPDMPRVSVLVPNRNHARFLERRLASIFAQTHPVAEVVLLDDASDDDSIAEARRVAAAWGRAITIRRNARPTGSAFGQWRRGAQRAKGELVWIAEADDEAEPEFLARLAAGFAAAPDAVLAACDSRAVDAAGHTLWPDHRESFAAAQAEILAQDGLFAARDFARHVLVERNLLVNASAVLWRRGALRAGLARVGNELAKLRLAGDWRLYLDVLLAGGGSVAWVAAPLNLHRRHGGGVTARLAAGEHIAEVARLHATIRAALPEVPQLAERQARYRTALAEQLRASAAPSGRESRRRATRQAAP